MKKNLLVLGAFVLSLGAIAQTPRLSLYEEFTGETCPPCAATNPALNALLASPTNTPKIVAIKWQVPIPSAPTKTWSLYQTNKTEIDWRWRTIANGGYGYTPAINSAPSSKIDGQEATVFGAASGHPANLNNNVIASAQSKTCAFSVTMQREWASTGTAVNLTVNIQATAPFTAVGPLVFRTVMVERLIQFSVQPGTNGEKDFEDVAIKSFPTLQNGVSMASNWTVGQTQTFTLSCAIPSYVRKIKEIAFVGFIQDDGNQKVAQAVRADKAPLLNDAVAVNAQVKPSCSGQIDPQITIMNNGQNAITAMTITPYIDGVAGTLITWNGNLAPASSTVITVNGMVSPTAIGPHTFSYNITSLAASDNDASNNSASVKYVVSGNFLGNNVQEGFTLGAFPPALWTSVNPDNGLNWTRATGNGIGAYGFSNECAKYDFFGNTAIGDKDELYMPPMDLSGANAPVLSFDVAYAQRTANSNDKLEVFVSDNCGANWTSVYSSAGANLATFGPFASAFTPNPNSASDWKTEQVTLTGYNKSNILTKFVTTNDNGNNLYLDNVNLSQSAPTGITKSNRSLGVNLYPNPTNGITNVNITTANTEVAKITVVNALGQVVYTKQVNVVTGSNNIQIDTGSFANGIYNVTVSTSNSSTVKTLSVSK